MHFRSTHPEAVYVNLPITIFSPRPLSLPARHYLRPFTQLSSLSWDPTYNVNIAPQPHSGAAVTRKDRVIAAGPQPLLRMVSSLREASIDHRVKMPVPTLQPKATASRPESPHASFAQEIPFLFYFSILLGHIHLGSSSKRFIEHLTQVLVKLRKRKPWLQAALLLLIAARTCGCGCTSPRPGQVSPVSHLCTWPSVLLQGRRCRRTPSRKDPAP